MSPKLRRLSGRKVISILAHFGFTIQSQKGSHVKLWRIGIAGEKQTINHTLAWGAWHRNFTGHNKAGYSLCSGGTIKTLFLTVTEELNLLRTASTRRTIWTIWTKLKITRFEDLDCWQAARKLVGMVYQAIRTNDRLSRDLRFTGQFSSAAVSCMSNIAEGFGRETDREFMRGLWISKGSVAEVQSLCYAALDQEYLSKEDMEQIYSQADKVGALDSGMIKYLRNSTKRRTQWP